VPVAEFAGRSFGRAGVAKCFPGCCMRMSEESPDKLADETVATLRTLAHDLSNAIENVMQASYLLAQAELDEQNAKWLALINAAAQDAVRINRQIRDILKSRS
jgi:GAF domain-containing protein